MLSRNMGTTPNCTNLRFIMAWCWNRTTIWVGYVVLMSHHFCYAGELRKLDRDHETGNRPLVLNFPLYGEQVVFQSFRYLFVFFIRDEVHTVIHTVTMKSNRFDSMWWSERWLVGNFPIVSQTIRKRVNTVFYHDSFESAIIKLQTVPTSSSVLSKVFLKIFR